MLRLDRTEDFVVRRAVPQDAARLGRVRAASWRDAYDGILPDAELRKLSATRSAQRLRDAMRSRRGQVVYTVHSPSEYPFGYAWGGPQPDPAFAFGGEIYEMYLDPGHQRRGAGRQLLASTLWQLAAFGLWPVLIWSLAENPARHFYEACGGRQVLAGSVEVAGHALPRVGYAWEQFLPLPSFVR
ncbi:MAG: GNAT family N-acetyltransferase [Myxococcota bacterium]